MRKAIAFSVLFVMVFAMAVGFTLTTAEQAHAFPTIIYCSRDTGPNCTNALRPYYMYVQDRTGRHFVGCCSANTPD